MMKKINLGIVGVTGLVGTILLKVLEEKQIPINILKVFASSKSEGKRVYFNTKEYIVETLKEGCFSTLDYVLFTCGKEVSKIWVEEALKNNIKVIDNSSYFRLRDESCLLIPEVNITSYQNQMLISNPNCSTIQSLVAIKPIEDLFRINKIIYSTYQSVSGGGKKLLDELNDVLSGKNHNLLPYNISKSLIPEIDSYDQDEYSKEETKMILETKKILSRDDLLCVATCVRVPIFRTHAVSIYLECEKETSVDLLIEKYKEFNNIVVLNNLKEHLYPVGEKSLDNDCVYVGRIRKVKDNPKALLLYVVSDNLRKGAASNMAEILKKLINLSLL